MQRQRRRVTRIVLFLFAGAIVNVAVAWGCAALIRPISPHVRFTKGWCPLPEPVVHNGTTFDWIIERADAFGMTRLHANHMRSDRFGAKGPEASAICPAWSDYPRPLHDGSVTGLNIAAYGWPLRSLLFRWAIRGSLNEDGSFNPPAVLFVRGIELPDFDDNAPSFRNMSYIRALPWESIWPGFAINTIFYAAVLWMVFAFPFVVRRRRRIKCGLCQACAYPGGTSPVCTECGKPVTSNSVEPS